MTAPKLTVEQAKGLAQRWYIRCPFCRNHPGEDIRDGMVVDCQDCEGTARAHPPMRAYEAAVAYALVQPLAYDELAGLLAWVREYMQESDTKVREVRAEIDARRVAKGMAPTKRISASRDGLVLSVAVQLDLVPWQTQADFTEDELAPARALCDLAWPWLTSK